MDNLALSEQKRSKSPVVDQWNSTGIAIHSVLAPKSKSKDLNNLRIFDVNLMPTNHCNPRFNKDQERPHKLPIEDCLRNANKTTLNNLKNHDPCLPYSINTVHLQNPYRTPQRHEGFALRDISVKGMYPPRESTLRSRYNKNTLPRKETLTPINFDRDDGKFESKNELQRCWNNSEISTTAKQYCMNSTLHGLRYVGDSNLSLTERVFWIISFIAAVSTAGYYIWFLYQKWVSSPIIISLSPEPVSLNEFPFPSITICNMNNVKNSEAKRINKGNDMLEKLLLDDICNTDNATVAPDLLNEATNWTTVLRFMINVSQSCNDMLYSCRWHGNQTECEKIFNPTMTDEGICCNFNSVNRKHLFYNPRDWSDLNITFPYPGIDWNPETGYEGNVPADYIPWRPYGAGLFYGLTLVLDAQVHEYFCSSTASVGFKMLLHNPVETPKIADFAVALTPGEETRVIVTPKVSTASRSIINVPLRKRKCFFTSERKLRYYRTYTQRNCILECEANFTEKICHCVQYYMPSKFNHPNKFNLTWSNRFSA